MMMIDVNACWLNVAYIVGNLIKCDMLLPMLLHLALSYCVYLFIDDMC